MTRGRCGSRQCGANDHEDHEQHGCRPTTRIASVFSVAQSGRARRAVVRTWSESVRLVPKNLGIGRPRTLADDIPGGAIGMVYLLRGKTSKPRNPCEHLCASLVWVTSFLDDIPGGAIGQAFLERGMQTSQSLRTLFVPASPGSRAGLLLLSIRERIGGREFRNNPLCSRTL